MATKASRATDAESSAIIYEGATVRQLSIIFSADPKVIQRKIAGLVPVGKREGTNVYSIPEAASRLVKPSYDIERYIMGMNHLDLPPLLAKEFWNAQRSRLTFEEMNADLWRTADVVRAISLLFNSTRRVLMLLPDTLEREAGLSREQKAIVRRVVDGALVDGRDQLIERFKSYGVASDYFGAGGNTDIDLTGTDLEDSGGTGVLEAEEAEDEYNGL